MPIPEPVDPAPVPASPGQAIPSEPAPAISNPGQAIPENPTPVPPGTTVRTIKQNVPIDSTVVTAVIPAPYTSSDVSQVSLEQLAGDGAMSLLTWAASGQEVTAKLSSQAINPGDYQLSILLLK